MEFPAERKTPAFFFGYSKASCKAQECWQGLGGATGVRESQNGKYEGRREWLWKRFTGRGIKNIYTVQTNPSSHERMKLLIYSSPAPGQELQATSSGGWQVRLEWISQKSTPNPSPCARGGVFTQHLPAEAVFSSAATKNLLPSCTGMMEGSWVFLTSYFGVNNGYFVSMGHSWCCSWMKKIKSWARCGKINFHLQAEIQQSLKNCILQWDWAALAR